MSFIKRVCCLYRVSTERQVEKDDIPMQKLACHAFAEEKGWEITEEHYEKGVSGYSLSAEQRDVMREIKQSALNKNFDILLVFMFDRIGRREDETPFVVQFFAGQGIEVWSTQEGQQRFDNHVDKLMNYIRFWQASGESEKTSLRTKTRLGQIVKEGKFRGGTCPYGYELRKTGRLNKRGDAVYDIFIEENEAHIVKTIYEKYALEGMGTHQLANYLTEKSLLPRKGLSWHPSTILHILKNVQYVGVLRSGKSHSEPFPHLAIIERPLFEKAQKLISSRSRKTDDTRTTPMSTMGRTLLSGNCFCTHCGGRLTPSTGGGKRALADGTLVDRTRTRYTRYNKTRKRKPCNGQTTYDAKKVDKTIENTIRIILTKLKGMPKQEVTESLEQSQLTTIRNQLDIAAKALAKEEKVHSKLEQEIVRCITGESDFSKETLAKLIQDSEIKVEQLREQTALLQEELHATELRAAENKQKMQELVSWADIFDTCNPAQKKMVVSTMLDKVMIGKGQDSRDYSITIQFSEDLKAFL